MIIKIKKDALPLEDIVNNIKASDKNPSYKNESSSKNTHYTPQNSNKNAGNIHIKQ